MTDQLALPFDKRWIGRREVFVAPPDRIRASEFGVAVLREGAARAFVSEHHYSGSFVFSRLSVGLYRKTGVAPAALVGVAVFSVPMQQQAIPAYTGLQSAEGVELGRFLCLPEVAFNGESWFLRRAIAALRGEKPEVRAILSYSDPMERTTIEGLMTKPGHYGQIYQASNAAFLGRSARRWVNVAPDGQIVSDRALSKIRGGERGQDYAARQLIGWGADARRSGEEPRDWLDRVLRPPLFRRLRHPGNFAYVFALDRTTRLGCAARQQPYPRAMAHGTMRRAAPLADEAPAV
jgi:hypothetical protein